MVGNGREHRAFSASGDRGGRGAHGDPRQVGHAWAALIGLADANIYSRKKRALRAGARREGPSAGRPRAIETMIRSWIGGLRAADLVLQEAAMVTRSDDREGDIYEKYAAPRSAHVHLLGRADHDRVLCGGSKLFAAMAAGPDVPGRQISIPAKGRPARPHREDPRELARDRNPAAALELQSKSNGCPAVGQTPRGSRSEEVDPPEASTRSTEFS